MNESVLMREGGKPQQQWTLNPVIAPTSLYSHDETLEVLRWPVSGDLWRNIHHHCSQGRGRRRLKRTSASLDQPKPVLSWWSSHPAGMGGKDWWGKGYTRISGLCPGVAASTCLKTESKVSQDFSFLRNQTLWKVWSSPDTSALLYSASTELWQGPRVQWKPHGEHIPIAEFLSPGILLYKQSENIAPFCLGQQKPSGASFLFLWVDQHWGILGGEDSSPCEKQPQNRS